MIFSNILYYKYEIHVCFTYIVTVANDTLHIQLLGMLARVLMSSSIVSTTVFEWLELL